MVARVFLLLSLLLLSTRQVLASKRSDLLRRKRPDLAAGLETLHSSLLPNAGELSGRISGLPTERRRPFVGGVDAAITIKSSAADPVVSSLAGRRSRDADLGGGVLRHPVSRRDALIAQGVGAGVAAGIAAAAGVAADLPAALGGGGGQQQPGPRPIPSRYPTISSSSSSAACTAAARPLLEAIESALSGTSQQLSAAVNSSSSSSKAAHSTFQAQAGYIDFGTTSSSANGSAAACAPNCAFSNPTSAYGIVVLPLSPGEDQQAKRDANTTPGYAAANMDGRFGPGGMAPTWQLRADEVVVVAGCAPPAAAARYFGATAYLYSAFSSDDQRWLRVFGSLGDTASIIARPRSSAASSSEAFREPAAAADGFEVTGRLNTTQPLRPAAAGDAGETRPVVALEPGSALGTDDIISLANEEDYDAAYDVDCSQLRASDGSCRLVQPGAARSDTRSSSSSSSSPGSFSGFTVFLMGASPSTVKSAAQLIRAAVAAAEPEAAGLGSRFINILPIAAPDFTDAIGLQPQANYYSLLLRAIARSGGSGATELQAFLQTQPLWAWRLTPAAEAAPDDGSSSSSSDAFPVPAVIPRKITTMSAAAVMDAAALAGPAPMPSVAASDGSGNDGISVRSVRGPLMQQQTCLPMATGPRSNNSTAGMAALNSSCNLLQQFGAAVAAGVAAAMRQVVQEPPVLQQLSLSTQGQLAAAAGGSSSSPLDPGNSSTGGVFRSAGGAGEPAVAGASGPTAPDDWWAAARLTPTAAQQQQLRSLPSLREQQLLLDELLAAVDALYSTSHALFHGLGSASTLDLLGVDWGLDCLSGRLDLCNGDNRDATYLTSWPLLTLNRPGQLLLVAGVNHVAAGLAGYMNVAATDPLQQLGLVAFDDQELMAAAPAAATLLKQAAASASNDSGGAGGSSSSGNLLFLVAFSRDCTGVPLPCKTIGRNDGAGAGEQPDTPLTRPLMTIARIYSNPITGVGPAAADTVPFATVLLTPNEVAVPADRKARTPLSVWQAQEQPGNGAEQDTSSFRTAAARTSAGAGNRFNIWSSSDGEFDQAAATAATTCPDQTGTSSNDTTAAANTAGGGSAGGSLAGFGQSPCVRSFVGLSQCSGEGSSDVCCGHVAGWSAADCWCKAAGQALLQSMPALLPQQGPAPAALQFMSWLCETPES